MTIRRRAAAAALVGLTLVAVACGSDNTDAFSFKPLDTGGPLTKAALEKGDVDVALLFSSDADIGAKGWVDLTDDKQLQQNWLMPGSGGRGAAPVKLNVPPTTVTVTLASGEKVLENLEGSNA